MAYVPIPKDLTKVKTKFLLGLTKRQLICFVLAAAIGLPLFFLTRGVIPTTASALLMMIVMLPFFLFAMYEKNGQPLEAILKNIIETKFTRPRIRYCATNNLYAATARQAKLYKEVHAIATGKNSKKAHKGKKQINSRRKKAD